MRFEERYKLQVPIEQGERGTLWSGQDTKLARKVVVAVVEADAPEALRARFSEQMEKLAKLRHANLVRVLEVGRTEDDAPYAAMEVAEGDTLEKCLREGPPMRVDQAVRMMADLCGALSALHGAGIAHGDVHPGNVIVRELGGRLSPKLRGVGMNGAEQRKGDEEGGEPTALAYMAPAQARGEVLADAASDVYSTAAMVFSVLTGRLPHRGASVEAMRRAIVERAAPAAVDVRAELAGPIAEVLDTALSPDPERRFSTADALAKALRTALIRTRNPGALETVVGARTLEVDDSDEELAAKRATKAPANAPGAKPGAAPVAIPRPGVPRPAAVKPKEPPAELPTAPVVAKAAPPAETKPAARRDESLEFERLSGLLDVAEPAAPPPPPGGAGPGKSAGEKAKANDSLEFERLSGLLEVPQAPEPTPPPPPPDASPVAPSEASASPEPGSAPAGGEAQETSPESTAEAEAPNVPPALDAPVAPKDPPAAPKSAATAASSPQPPQRQPSQPQPSPEVFEAEEIAAARSGTPGWIWAAMGVGLAAAIVLAVVVASSGEEPGSETASIEPRASSAMEEATPEASEEVAAEPVAEPAAPAVPVEPPVEEPPAPEPIRLTLTNVPAGATITVDGAAVEGTELELAPSEASRTVAVQLEGHEEWTQSVPGDSSAELRVELRPVPAVEEPRAERRVERRRTRRASRGRPDRARPSRARPSRRGSAAPSKRTVRRRGSRPAAISDPGF